MESLAKFKHHHHPLHLSSLKSPSFTKPISSISLKPPPKPFLILNSSSSPSSSSSSPVSSPISPTPKTLQKISPFETPNPLSSLLKATCITIATASLFFTRFTKLSIAAPIAKPTVESSTSTDEQTEEEKVVEEYLDSNPNDVKALRTLMEVKIQEQKLDEAISVLDRLIKIEPLDTQYPLLKAHLRIYSGEVELAKVGFEEMLKKDPLSVEAYHGLALSQSEPGEMEAVVKRIEGAMKKCERENRIKDCRDFKMLLAQIKSIEGNNKGALKLYEELVKEDPEDFRPHFYLAIIYTQMRKTGEAKKHFDEYQRLVPKDHPFAQQFEDSVMSTEAFQEIFGGAKSD